MIRKPLITLNTGMEESTSADNIGYVKLIIEGERGTAPALPLPKQAMGPLLAGPGATVNSLLAQE